MKGSACCVLLICLLNLLLWRGQCQEECGKAEYMTEEGHCAPCIQCPPGQEPDGVCGFGSGAGLTCRKCAPGMFSGRSGMSLCSPHTECEKRRRVQLSSGTPSADAQCGDCLSGFFSPVAKTNRASTCFPCWLGPPDTMGCEGFRTLRSRSPRTIESASKPENKLPLNSTQTGVPEDSGTQYAVLAIVPVFCMMGLMGIFLCNLLKKKGYHCTSQKEMDVEASPPEKNGINGGMEENGNEDTIGVLVRLIAEKKENAVALEELLKEYQSKQMPPTPNKAPHRLHLLPQMPHFCKHQQHLHTVQGLASRSGSCCTRCSQKKWTNVLVSPDSAPVSTGTSAKGSKPGGKVGRQGEITILSVGRFRVARIPEQKQSSPDVKTISDPQGAPRDDCTEQRVLLSKTGRVKNHSMEDTSKLEDVI